MLQESIKTFYAILSNSSLTTSECTCASTLCHLVYISKPISRSSITNKQNTYIDGKMCIN